ncbi:MAG: tetratricopeptide repeat protein [Candidatus Aminicenantes bacterium]
MPIVFVINTDNLKKIINGASDLYQLRELPDFHFEDSGVVDNDLLKITSHDFGQIKDSDSKASLLEEQLKIVTKKQEADKNVLNNIVVPLLNLYIDKNDFKKVEELFDRHIKGKEELIRDKIVLGDCYRNLFDNGKAINFYKQALEIFEKIEGMIGVSGCLFNIGMIYQDKGDDKGALEKFQKSLEISEKIGDIAGAARSMNQIGLIHEEKKEYTTALKLFSQVFQIFSKIGSSKVNTVKDNIDRIREKMPKEEFEAIAKEFEGMDNWIKKEPDP